MRTSTRLVVNTLVILGRMPVTAVLSLYATRLLVKTLGVDDYGILTVLGASLLVLTLLHPAMSGSTRRHLAFEVGQGNRDRLRSFFNTSLLAFLSLGLAVIVCGTALGPLVLRIFDIPPERLTAAKWVYSTSVFGIGIAVIGAPFRSILEAHQMFVVVAVNQLVASFFLCGAAVSLLFLSGDLLVQYATMFLLARVLAEAVPAVISMWLLSDSRPRPSLANRGELRRMSIYAGWILLERISTILRMQAGLMLLNIRFGPAVNAAYAIACQIGGYQSSFDLSLRRVVAPVVIGAEARSEREKVRLLGLLSTKYTMLLLSFLFIPLVLETPIVFHLWLDTVPPYSVIFTRLVLVWVTVDLMTRSYVLILQAMDDIGYDTRVKVLLMLASLSAAAVWFYGFGAGPWTLPVTSVVAAVLLTCFRVIWVGARVGMTAAMWFQKSVRPVVLVLCLATLPTLFVQRLLDSGTARLLAVVAVYAIAAVPLIWFWALQDFERRQFWHVLRTAVSRAQKRGA